MGFAGGVLVDYPNSTKAKKYYLVLLAGVPDDGFKEQVRGMRVAGTVVTAGGAAWRCC